MVRTFALATDGAALQVVQNELSYLELLAVFSILSDLIQNGKAGFPMPGLQVPLKPAEEPEKKEK